MEKSQWKILLNSSFFAWIIFFLSPILSFPFAINGCYRNRKNAYLLFALLMGVCALLLYPPRADSYRHYLQFSDIALMDWGDLLLYLSLKLKPDFLLYILEYYFVSIDLSFGYIRFFLVVIAYVLYLKLYDYFCKSPDFEQVSRKKIFWFVILIVPIATISNGLRYGFAAVLISFFICKRYIFLKKTIWDYLLVVISLCFHFGIILIMPLLVLRSCGFYIKRKVLFILLFIFLFFISNTFALIVSILPLGDLSSILQMYTEGKYADTSYLSGNFFFWLPIIFNNVVQFLIAYLCVKRMPCNKGTSLVYNLFLLWAFVSSFYSVNGRVMFFFSLYGLLFLIAYQKGRMLKNFYLVYTFNIVLSLVIGWRIHTITRWPYLFAPFSVALSKDYDENWIHENIDPISADPYLYSR